MRRDAERRGSGAKTTQYLFFGGKGGTGKTTCAAAAAIASAERGRRVLVISTDPAHSLGDVLRRRLTAAPSEVAVRRGSLHACELDADAALARWLASRRPALARILERGTWLDRAAVESFLDLAVPGVDELLALLEIERLGRSGAYDRVVIDTAPTGHTLRLLASPATYTGLARVLDVMREKDRVLASALARGSRPDTSDALIDEVRADGKRLDSLLRDRVRTRLRWVLLPEALSVAESRRALEDLAADGIHVSDMLVNRLTPPPPSACAFCDGRRAAESEALVSVGDIFARSSMKLWIIPAQEVPARGATALRSLTESAMPLERWTPAKIRRAGHTRPVIEATPNTVESTRLGRPSTRLLIVGGKGGVGKTTCAAALALAIARERPRREVLLLSTDPAHSLGDVFEQPIGDTERRVQGGPPNLAAREVDAKAGWHSRMERYRALVSRLFDTHVGESVHATLSLDRAMVEELFALAPPGMDEIAGMLAIVDALFPSAGERRVDLVVVDTAPTGHALRLLAAPGQALAWVREFMRALLEFEGFPGFGDLASELLALSRGLNRLNRLLTSARATGFVVVTRPEPLPVAETTRLLHWLQAHGIARRALILNGWTPVGCRRCRRAAARERRDAAPLTGRAPRGPLLVLEADALARPPQGVGALEAWSSAWRACPPVDRAAASFRTRRRSR